MPYALDTYTGDGTKTDFEVTFPYIQRNQVRVFQDTTELTVVTDGTPVAGQYKWEDNETILVGTPPPSGTPLKVLRDTPKGDQIVDWVNGSYIVAADLNTSDLQWLYSIQELIDRVNEIDGTVVGEAVKSISGIEPIQIDDSNPQTPVVSIDEFNTTGDPNDLTSDTRVMSEAAVDKAFKNYIGTGPAQGQKFGQIRVDDSGTTNTPYFWNGAAWVQIGVEGGPPGPPGPAPGLQDPPAEATTVPLNPDGTLGTATALVSQDPNSYDLKFLFGIPQGLTGPEGPKGATGDGVDYLGVIDATTAPEPADPAGGDFYMNSGTGTSSWTGLSTVENGDRLIYNAHTSEWDRYAPPPVTGAVVPGDPVSILDNDAGYITLADIPPQTVPTLQQVLDTGNTSTTDLFVGTGGETVKLQNTGTLDASADVKAGGNVEAAGDVKAGAFRIDLLPTLP